MFNKKKAKYILQKCLETGADFAELYIEKNLFNSITCDNKSIEKINYSENNGIGIRIIKNTDSVYGYTNNFKKNNLVNLIEILNKKFNEDKKNDCKDFYKKKIKNDFKNKNSFFNIPDEEKISFLKNTCDKINKKSSLIFRNICAISSQKKNIEIFNTNGLYAKDIREKTYISIEIKAKQDSKQENVYESFIFNEKTNSFKNINLEKKINEMVKDVLGLLNAKKCPSKKMMVIIGNGNGGTLFHEACGHAIEASSVAIGLSVFTNRINTQIASKLVNAYDDGTIKNAWGTFAIDDEGNETKRNCLIKNGILVNYLVDSFNGRKMNIKSNGVCRRQNYQFEPTSRMTNTFIDNGPHTFEEIIKNTKFGLYAKKISGGSVEPTTGEFEFSVDIAYIVRNGKICEQVKGAMLIGKCEEILKNIDMVGNDLELSQGFCSASSGTIPVSVGQPTIRIKSMLVGGNDEKI